jgi:hypothetical protein
VNVGFPKKLTFANNKKIQSSKSWYLKIALILIIENPLPRGVVDRMVKHLPGGVRTVPTMQHLKNSRKTSKQTF